MYLAFPSDFRSEQQNDDQIYYGQMIYTRPYYRMGAYLVGISAGELLLHKPKLHRVSILYMASSIILSVKLIRIIIK